MRSLPLLTCYQMTGCALLLSFPALLLQGAGSGSYLFVLLKLEACGDSLALRIGFARVVGRVCVDAGRTEQRMSGLSEECQFLILVFYMLSVVR